MKSSCAKENTTTATTTNFEFDNVQTKNPTARKFLSTVSQSSTAESCKAPKASVDVDMDWIPAQVYSQIIE